MKGLYRCGLGVLWLCGILQGLSASSLASPPARRVPNDYNGDGRSDLAVYEAARGRWYIRTLEGEVLAGPINWGFYGGECVPGDYNGDGTTDLGIYDPATGRWFIREMDGTILAFSLDWGFPCGEAVAADFDGDGADDLGIYDTSSARWYVRNLAGAVLLNGEAWGYDGCEPLAGYFGGAAVPVAFSDKDYKFYARGQPAQDFMYGQEEEGLLGDFDGDGYDDYALYDASAGYWRLWGSQSYWGFQSWGFAGAVPVAGDFDGDGQTDFAVYYAAGGLWHILSRNAGTWSVSWGGASFVAAGRRMANPKADASTLRFVDQSSRFSYTAQSVTDLERNKVHKPGGSAAVSLLPGWYRVDVKWYGATSGIIKWYKAGSATRYVSVEPRRNYRVVLSGGSITPPFYSSPSTQVYE